jgi:hypothetical protein
VELAGGGGEFTFAVDVLLAPFTVTASAGPSMIKSVIVNTATEMQKDASRNF